ncbi:MAG: hypothetical protein JRI93_01080 [Deltaproteobacteria bacterium]|nr:hypothetical protein [Deltaproteobacteria bacterium]MBW2677079.1 hypothetical protein [Deltaproteobacteria bacterium]
MNDAGRMVATVWNELPQRFSIIELIEYVIMPNHIHGIIAIVGVPLVGTRKTVGDAPKRADTRPAPTAGLGDIVGAFKSITTHEYIRGVKQHGWSPFPGKLWQRNYYEHIVRNKNEMALFENTSGTIRLNGLQIKKTLLLKTSAIVQAVLRNRN